LTKETPSPIGIPAKDHVNGKTSTGQRADGGSRAAGETGDQTGGIGRYERSRHNTALQEEVATRGQLEQMTRKAHTEAGARDATNQRIAVDEYFGARDDE